VALSIAVKLHGTVPRLLS